MGHVHGRFRIFVFAGIRSTLVESHDDIGTYLALNIDCIFRGKHVIGTIDMGFKLYTFFFYFSIGRKGVDLIAARIGQQRPIPTHEFMEPTRLLQYIGARTQIEMVGIPQNNIGVDFIF